MKVFTVFSNAFTITVSIYIILLVLLFAFDFEFFPEIMFTPLGIFSVFSLAFVDLFFIEVG
ncbi:MAG: hypothetical protein JW703_01215 [Candidatus Diapherotrites archaeon]|nr:hypothetical protein [Candidatus Diapherotrites archaeon]